MDKENLRVLQLGKFYPIRGGVEKVAYDLMKEGGQKIVDVYAKVGFKNPSHFSTAFKKQYGIPPTAVSLYA